MHVLTSLAPLPHVTVSQSLARKCHKFLFFGLFTTSTLIQRSKASRANGVIPASECITLGFEPADLSKYGNDRDRFFTRKPCLGTVKQKLFVILPKHNDYSEHRPEYRPDQVCAPDMAQKQAFSKICCKRKINDVCPCELRRNTHNRIGRRLGSGWKVLGCIHTETPFSTYWQRSLTNGQSGMARIFCDARMVQNASFNICGE
jgi:hypothetical protein